MREPTKDVTFGDDDRRPMRVEGEFPAHICGMSSREFGNGNEVFNMTVRFAAECKDVQVPKYMYDAEGVHKRKAVKDDEGEQVYVSAAFYADMEMEDDGTWFYEVSKESWQTNEKYADRMEALGIDFPEIEVGKGKHKSKKKVLQKIDADDVLGLPVIAKVGFKKVKVREENDKGEWVNKLDADGKQVYAEYLKVIDYLPWEDGDKIKIEEGDEPPPF